MEFLKEHWFNILTVLCILYMWIIKNPHDQTEKIRNEQMMKELQHLSNAIIELKEVVKELMNKLDNSKENIMENTREISNLKVRMDVIEKEITKYHG